LPIRQDGGSTGAIAEHLRRDLARPEFSEGYAESFQDAYIATQIKVLREQHQLTQAKLAERLNTTQTVISRIENVNYAAWSTSTLKKLARVFRVRVRVSFETYGSLIHDMENFSRESLQRAPREADPELLGSVSAGRLFVMGSGAERQADSDATQGRSEHTIFENFSRRSVRSETLSPDRPFLSDGAMKVATSA
jgi:HTH-type transcriptional regulator / antitoxin HipB